MPQSTTPPLDVRHNPSESRFETVVDGQLCRADYRMMGDVMAVVHTEVPYAIEGRGIAGQMVEAIVAHARDHGIKIAPYCSFVSSYIRRHPELQDVLA